MSTISIYASFSQSSRILRDNWPFIHCLAFPLETANQYSVHPYKWLRYCIGTIIGAEGDLSTSPYSSDGIVDYDEALPEVSTKLFYHITPEERQRMFPIDPHIFKGRSDTLFSSSIDDESIRGDTFREEVGKRDGFNCIITKLCRTICDATHIIPNTKGDEYIEKFTRGRSRDSAGADIITDIDSARNGVFMAVTCHMAFGKRIAILQTPNFAMDSADIDPTVAPNEKRWTYHLFKERPDVCNPANYPSGSEVRMNRDCDPSQNPPAILLDAAYAGLILSQFGTRELKDCLAVFSDNVFYPKGHLSRVEQRTKERGRMLRKRAALRENASDGPDIWDMLLGATYLFRGGIPPPHDVEMDENRIRFEEEEKRRAQDKVDVWIKDIQNI
ncbi:hypothetical protein BDN70DRAFT_896072 [Pholiota conissans]|uniref:HNH nuclease domain-containing protein n=1 Tax=Pholiota conissans TaxID=109636 RepID=A0A9P5YZL0_9AGAR|nr:hypothetical protein BDN70DRAFT_896072 [Pholiota conissans]